MRWLIWLRRCGTAARRRFSPQVGAALFAHARAQGLVEYALILLMMVIVCIVIVTLIGEDVSQVWYEKIVSAWPQ
jgi:small-conductance mechanosensitive channel